MFDAAYGGGNNGGTPCERAGERGRGWQGVDVARAGEAHKGGEHSFWQPWWVRWFRVAGFMCSGIGWQWGGRSIALGNGACDGCQGRSYGRRRRYYLSYGPELKFNIAICSFGIATHEVVVVVASTAAGVIVVNIVEVAVVVTVVVFVVCKYAVQNEDALLEYGLKMLTTALTTLQSKARGSRAGPFAGAAVTRLELTPRSSSRV